MAKYFYELNFIKVSFLILYLHTQQSILIFSSTQAPRCCLFSSHFIYFLSPVCANSHSRMHGTSQRHTHSRCHSRAFIYSLYFLIQFDE